MTAIDFTQMFLETTLKNSYTEHNFGRSEFDTVDRIYLEEGKYDDDVPRCTDYAVMCGAYCQDKKAVKWYRTAGDDPCEVQIRNAANDLFAWNFNAKDTVVCPVMRMSVDTFWALMSNTKLQMDYSIGFWGQGKVHLGLEFPSERVDPQKCRELERLLKQGKLTATGATYTGAYDHGQFIHNPEYRQRNRYVRVMVPNRIQHGNEFNDGTKCPNEGTYTWAKVQPIEFTIRNWDDLPQSINPQGAGKTDYLELAIEQGILAMPFFASNTSYVDNVGYGALWQNSTIRAYLNSYNLKKEIDRGNGDRDYQADTNFNFEGRGFLYEATQHMRERTFTMDKVEVDLPAAEPDAPATEHPNPYGFTYDELSNDDLLKLYIQSKTPVFLHGPSGVGKSSRVKQIDPNPTHITLRPQMNPEEVDGTLDRETGKYIPPLWYTQLCEKCEKDPEHIHTLFIDELTNVKPTVQSLVYSIILDRAGKDGLWPLPDNSVVVAAGNENADNLAAYPLTNALFRRLSHIYYQVDKEAWLDWAMGVNKLSRLMPVAPDKAKHARIHPAIVAFIASQKDNILNQDLDEEDPKIVTDPRKWEIASNVLYSTKNPNALQPAVGEEITASFVDFVQSIQITVEDVVKGNYDPKTLTMMDFAKKHATAVGLCTATEKDLPAVRQFIQKYLGQEVRALFDSLWIRNDPERAAVIGELDTSIELNQKETANGIER